jgi:hypothetical protein
VREEYAQEKEAKAQRAAIPAPPVVLEYDSQKKKGRFIIGSDSVSITGDYDPLFVERIKKIPGRKWNSATKAWVIPAGQQAAARAVFDKHYNDESNESVRQSRVREEYAQEKEAKAQRATIPATQKQKDYITQLGHKYKFANGKNVNGSAFGEMTMEQASVIIEGLKLGEEYVSYMGIFER